MLKSINAWSFEAGTSVADMARQAAEAGFAGLELTLEEEGELTAASSESDCVALGERVREAGLTPVGLATGLFWRDNYAAADAASRQRATDLTLAMLDRAAWIGTEAILVVPALVGRAGDAKASVTYSEALNRSYDALRELAYEAEYRGVTIGIENVWNRFLLSPVELAGLIDRVNSDWVGAYFDVGNVLAHGYPQDWITTLGHRIVRVHVKDFRLDPGGPEGFCALGEGNVDWPAVRTALEQAGYEGPLTYEGKGEPGDIAKRMETVLRA